MLSLGSSWLAGSGLIGRLACSYCIYLYDGGGCVFVCTCDGSAPFGHLFNEFKKITFSTHDDLYDTCIQMIISFMFIATDRLQSL